MVRKNWIAPAIFLFPSLAAAHTGVGAALGFSDGFLHPFGGLDHLLAMFAVGLFAAQLGGKAIWLVPGTFVTMMIAGALVGVFGLPLPGVEYGVALSVIAIALPVAFALGMPVGLAMALVAIFAVFHGYAHGSEIPEGAGKALYISGFALATALIHVAGILSGLGLAGLANRQL